MHCSGAVQVHASSDTIEEDRATMDTVDRLKCSANDMFRNGAFQQAIQDYTEAISLCESLQPVAGAILSTLYSNRAAARLKFGDYDKAYVDALAASWLEPSSVKALYRAAASLKHLGGIRQLAEAHSMLRAALSHEPSNKEVQQLLQEVQEGFTQAEASPASPGGPDLPAYVSPATLRFKALEHNVLQSFNTGRRKLWTKGIPENFVIHHLYHYGEFGFLLAGVKPCILLSHGKDKCFARDIVDKVVKPVMEEFELEAHGFTCWEIKHPLVTTLHEYPGWQGGWVLVNEHHPSYGLVRSVFLEPHIEPVAEEDVGRALGYPTLDEDSKVEYIDQTEATLQGVCCVTMLEYFCPKLLSFRDYVAIIRHYNQCLWAWRQLGRNLTIDVNENPSFERWHALKKSIESRQ